jgi:DNA-binding response OmpR family regulator
MRHELRTPINAILGYSQLLLEEADERSIKPGERRDLERVVDAGTQILRVINEVLDPAGRAGTMSASAIRLQHAVRVPLTTVHECLETLLRQHAHGTAGDDLRHIHTATVRLADAVVAFAHAVSVRASAGGDAPPLSSADAAGEAKAPDSADTASGGSILVIDDEEANRMLLRRRLIRDGYSVLLADTGETGLAAAAREPVDVILLDVMMPGMSGYEVLARLKADGALRDIPVLMITAVDGSGSVTRCIALGADDYLAKPFDPVVLGARVRACVTRKRARDFELAYLRGVAKVTAAAVAVETGHFSPDSLAEVAQRPDALGNLARLFGRMATEVAARQRRLEEQVQQLTIAIDGAKKSAEVREITESEYFRDLKARASHFSARRAARAGASE